jgi:hypothetical protein
MRSRGSILSHLAVDAMVQGGARKESLSSLSISRIMSKFSIWIPRTSTEFPFC